MFIRQRHALKIGLLQIVFCCLLSIASHAAALPPGAADLVAKLLPTVVAVEAIQHVPAAGDETSGTAPVTATTEETATGSGFIIDPTGIIITNHHVIKDASEIYVTLFDQTRLRATVIYTSPIDMVLLKIDAARPLPQVKFGDSTRMRPGDSVIAIGDPLGIGITVTAGIVSALERNLNETIYDNFMQIDAAINHGNSGGPLFNMDGEVVGINTALISPGSGSVGLGFSIPSLDVQFILAQWRKYGRVRLSYLGAATEAVTQDIADSAGLTSPRGVIVAAIAPGSPAAKIGLRIGDIILKIDGSETNAPRIYNRIVAASPFDGPVPMVLWRDGAEHPVSVSFTESKSSQDAGAGSPPAPARERPTELSESDVGVEVAPITDVIRKIFSLSPTQQGVVIIQVRPSSIASGHGLTEGQIVVQIGDKPIGSIDDMTKAITAARAANRRAVAVLVEDHDNGPQWVGIPIVSTAN